MIPNSTVPSLGNSQYPWTLLKLSNWLDNLEQVKLNPDVTELVKINEKHELED